MSLGRARQTLILTPEEKQKLELIAGRPKTSQSQALRARIVLACAGEGTHQSIARTLGTTPATVGKWRNRFVKNRLQALERSQPLLSLKAGQPERATHDYFRHGTTSLFAALDIATGKVIGRCHGQHRHQEFLRLLDTIDEQVPAHLDIDLVLDNYGTHKTAKVAAWFRRRPRYHLHFTPTSASWLNQVERWFAKITEQRIRRDTLRSVPQLIEAIMKYIQAHNRQPKPFVWTASAETIFHKLKKTF